MRSGASAAFSFSQDDCERTCLLVEVTRGRVDGTFDDLCSRIRIAVADALQLRLDVIVLVTPQSIAKTDEREDRATDDAKRLSARKARCLEFQSPSSQAGERSCPR